MSVAFPARRLWTILCLAMTVISVADTPRSSGGDFDCGSDIVPIVHFEQVPPIPCSAPPIDSALCGWIPAPPIDVVASPKRCRPVAPVTNNPAPVATAGPTTVSAVLAGLSAGSRWMHSIGPATDWQHRNAVTDLWSVASDTLDHLAETHAAARAFAAASDIVVEPAPVQTAASTHRQRTTKTSAQQNLIGSAPLVMTLAVASPTYDLAARALPRWTSLAADYAPFDLTSPPAGPAIRTAAVVPVADPIPHGQPIGGASIDASLRRDIRAAELQLAIVLDEASQRMAAQRRADDAMFAAIRNIQSTWNSLQQRWSGDDSRAEPEGWLRRVAGLLRGDRSSTLVR